MSKPNPYGVRAVRHLKSDRRKRLDRSGRVCATKQAVMTRTYDYFLREVDPIIGECITYLLCIRPDDVASSMLSFLTKLQNGETPKAGSEQNQKATKAQRLYLATQISPIITKLVNRIATTRPKEVLNFMCAELSLIINEEDSSKAGQSATDKINPSKSQEKAKGAILSEGEKKNEKKKSPKSINIIFLGKDGSGKSSFIDAIQGKFNDNIRPTIGFRPTTMMLGEDKIRLYDVGGGEKIRKIWPEYYHDAHAIVYMVDSSEINPESLKESIELFKNTVQHSMLHNKPIIFVSNKQDLAESKSHEIIKELYEVDGLSNCTFWEVSCSPGGVDSENTGKADPRLEKALEELLGHAQAQYEELNNRVQKDTDNKSEMEAKKRREKERKVLRHKILCAFPHRVNEAFLDADTPKEPEDTFSVEEGEAFLAAEIGVEKLPPIGSEVAALVGYQKLALQIIGALIQPISKKKKAISWEECKELVTELRLELGIVDI